MPSPKLYLDANNNQNFWRHVFQLICFIKSTDLNRLLYWGIPCLPSLTVSRPHSHRILLTAEEDGIFMRLNHTHTNCLKEGW